MSEQNISAREVLDQIRAIAMADVTQLAQVRDGELVIRSTDQLSPDLRRAVCAIEKSGGCLKVKFYDKLKALELLGKHLGLFDRQGAESPPENDLLQTILQSTGEVMATDDLPEVQQATAAGNDLVEPAGSA